MARKLKSDKLLFTATLLLVCTSIVMVYSASAVMALEQVPATRTSSCSSRLPGRCSGSSLVPIVMRIDYRHYRQPVVIWTALGVAAVALVAVLFATPVNGAQPLARASGRSASSRRSSRSSPSSCSRRRCSNGGWIASTSCRYALLPIGVVARRRSSG